MLRKILSILIVLTMLLTASVSLFSCDGDNNQNDTNEGEENNNGGEENNGSENNGDVTDGKTTYTITVVDGDGNPVVGARVQICDSNGCVPIMTKTNAEGKVTAEKTPSDFKAQINRLPDGYSEVVEGEKHAFDSNNCVTIVVNRNAE